MSTEPLTPENSAVVLVDHAVGFAGVIKSRPLADHLNAVVGLAKTAVLYESGLVVTNGPRDKPTGPLYPELLAVLGDHPVVERGGQFNAFEDDGFSEAVRATGRSRLVLAGVSTEGCLLQTVLGAQREGYETYVVVDASAGLSQEAHETAILRMTQAGVVPVTWFALASEYQWDQQLASAPHRFHLMEHHVPELWEAISYYRWAQEHGRTQSQAAKTA